MESYLPYLLPPLLGALIGYLTNYVAIRMLFRPLRQWRWLGIRVPLTPGIIPSKRGELAQRMGEMVGSHLLTSEDVGTALTHPGFRRELKGAVSDKLGRLLDREIGSLESLVPAYLEQVPRDPYDHEPLRYAPRKRIVYSIGPDGQDSGGAAFAYMTRTGDFSYRLDPKQPGTPSSSEGE